MREITLYPNSMFHRCYLSFTGNHGSFSKCVYADSRSSHNTNTHRTEKRVFVSPQMQRIFNPVSASERLIINVLEESVPELCP